MIRPGQRAGCFPALTDNIAIKSAIALLLAHFFLFSGGAIAYADGVVTDFTNFDLGPNTFKTTVQSGGPITFASTGAILVTGQTGITQNTTLDATGQRVVLQSDNDNRFLHVSGLDNESISFEVRHQTLNGGNALAHLTNTSGGAVDQFTEITVPKVKVYNSMIGDISAPSATGRDRVWVEYGVLQFPNAATATSEAVVTPISGTINTADTEPFQLTTHQPVTNAVGVALNSDIMATFNGDVRPSSITSNTFAVYGTFSGLMAGTPNLIGDTLTLDLSRDLFTGEQVQIIATADLEDMGSRPLIPIQWGFKAGPVYDRCVDSFSEVYPGSLTGVNFSSVAWGDYDNDGDLDVLLTGGYTRIAKVYENTGSGFSEVYAGSLAGVRDGSVAWGDYDNDGDLDILLTGQDSDSNGFIYIAKIYENTGSGFSEVYAGSLTGVFFSSVAWGDYDNDGDLDILLTGNNDSNPIAKVYENTGSSFSEAYAGSLTGVYYSSVAWGDYDNDGDLDILLTGNGKVAVGAHIAKVYENTGSGFSEVYAGSLMGVRKGSVAWGDYDNDGDLDILLTGDGSLTRIAKVYENTGSGFSEAYAGNLAGVGDGSVAWGDYDNDSDLDILLTGNNNGTPIAKVYENTGSGFNEVYAGSLTGVNYSSVAWGDYDNDGDLDILLTGNKNSTPIAKVYRNNDCTPDLAVNKTVNDNTLERGQTITYTVVISNSGSADATDAVVSDTLDANLTFVDGSVTLDPDQGGVTLAATATDLPILASGLTITTSEAVTISFQATVNNEMTNTTVITNTAAVTSSETTIPETDSVSVTVAVPRGSITVEKQTLPDGHAQTFTFEGDLNGTLGDGQTIFRKDLLPGTYAFTETVTFGWTLSNIACTGATGSAITIGVDAVFDTNDTNVNVDLAVGENVTCTFTNTKRYTLATVAAGTGTGSVSLSPTGGTYLYGTMVTATATANTGSTFTGWSGACTGTVDCVLTIDGAKSVTATFSLNSYNVTTTFIGTGSGIASLDPAGGTYLYGTAVTARATSNTGSTFSGWSGACIGTGDCVLLVNSAKSVTATFSLNSYNVSASIDGTGSGSVSLNPTGGTYLYGTVVTATATANTGSAFTGWNGACTGTGDCVLTVDSTKSVTASFSLNGYAVSTATDGTGSGSVSLDPAGGTYLYGTVITARATVNAGSTFAGWSGACTGVGDCILTVDSTKSVTASFSLNSYNVTTSTDGTGSGSVSLNPAGGTVLYGTVVTATATVNAGSTFAGWSGACTGVDDCILTVDSTKSVTASFSLNSYNVTTSTDGTGSGSVSLNPAGGTYLYGTVVTATATVNAGSTFAGWSGDCTGLANCILTVDSAKSIAATFSINGYRVSTATGGTGSGSVSLDPTGGIYAYGTVVTAMATAATGSTFAGWSGDCAGTGDCVLMVNSGKSVTATFNLIRYNVTTATAGTGSGSVILDPAGGTYGYGTVVTAMATAATGSTFSGWSNACADTDPLCMVAVDGAKHVTAAFDVATNPLIGKFAEFCGSEIGTYSVVVTNTGGTSQAVVITGNLPADSKLVSSNGSAWQPGGAYGAGFVTLDVEALAAGDSTRLVWSVTVRNFSGIITTSATIRNDTLDMESDVICGIYPTFLMLIMNNGSLAPSAVTSDAP